MNRPTWNQLFTTKIRANPTDVEYVNIRVSITPDNLRVITDIRKFRGTKGTRVGVGLFPNELNWFFASVTRGLNLEKDFDFRQIHIYHDVDLVKISVIKGDQLEQRMSLTHEQIEKLFDIKPSIIEAIETGTQNIENAINNEMSTV